jgi:uncharacterized protein
MILKRSIFDKIKQCFFSDEIILIIGSRQVGKTTLLRQIYNELINANKSCAFLNLEDPEYLGILNKHPKNLLSIIPFNPGIMNYVFIDEIQYLDNPSNFLKYLYDEYKEKLKIFVSSSSAFYIDFKFNESLAGRKRIFNLYTLSFSEFIRFKEADDLLHIDFNNISLMERNKIIALYNEYMVFGGYPKVVLSPIDQKRDLLQDLAFSYIKKDILESGIRNDKVFYKIFKILSSQIGNLLNSSELASTVSVSKNMIDNYIYLMQKSFHIGLLKPFFRNTRKELTKMPKIYFMDIGLRNFFLNNFESYLVRNDKGQLLENMLYRSLIEKYDSDNVRFWRTTQKNEVDFIVNENTAFEVKSALYGKEMNKYKLFLSSYPEISFSFVTFGSDIKLKNDIKYHQIWEI